MTDLPFGRPRCFIVHGVNVWDGGRASVDKIGPFFEARGYHVEQFDYGWRGVFGAWITNGSLAKKLAARSRFGDIAVGHSNGCAIIHLATYQGAAFRYVCYINPALDRDKAPGPKVERFDVWHSDSDTPVRLADLIPGNLWGSQGAFGYSGPDPRAVNHDKQREYPTPSTGHSDVFSDEKLRFFGPLIAHDAPAPFGIQAHH